MMFLLCIVERESIMKSIFLGNSSEHQRMRGSVACCFERPEKLQFTEI